MSHSSEWKRAQRARRKGEGICMYCGKEPARVDRVCCQACLDSTNARVKKIQQRHRDEAKRRAAEVSV